MKAITSSEFRANMASVLDKVAEDHEPVIVRRPGGKTCVVISLEDYDQMDETAYLLSTPANRRDLIASIAELNAGNGVARELIEE
jgi:antitoxin YefM